MAQAPNPPQSIPVFRWLAWQTISAAGCVMLGGIAAIIQQRFSPLILFPLLFGGACGGLAALVARGTKFAHRPTTLAGTILAVAAATYAFHDYSFQLAEERALADARHHAQLTQLHPEFARTSVAPPPASLAQFLSERAEAGRPLPGGYVLQGPGVWISWGVEALISLGAALVVLLPFLRHPYCDRCRSWYHTVRRGGLSRATSERAAQWTTLPDAHLPLEYRLLACDSGCGPTALEVSWPVGSSAQGVIPAGGTRLWLDDAQRSELLALLDAEARQPANVTDGQGSGVRSEPPNKT